MSSLAEIIAAIFREIKNKKLFINYCIFSCLLGLMFMGFTAYTKLAVSLDMMHLRMMYMDSELNSKRFKPIPIPTKKNLRGDFFKINGKTFYILPESEPVPENLDALGSEQKIDLSGKYLITDDAEFQIIRLDKTPVLIENKKNNIKRNKPKDYTKPLRRYHDLGKEPEKIDLDTLQRILDDI